MKTFLSVFFYSLHCGVRGSAKFLHSAMTVGLDTYIVPEITGTPPPPSCGLPVGNKGNWYKFVPTQTVL